MSCHAFRASAARYLLLALLLSTLALFTPSAEAGGTTYQLSPGDDIQAAITKSVSGDTIQLSAGTYNITTTLDTLGKGIMLIGEVDIEGVPISVLDGGHVEDVTDGVRVLICQQGEGPDTVFQNLVVQNGYSVDDPSANGAGDDEVYMEGGGGLLITGGSSPTLNNCTFRKNISEFGGGVTSYSNRLSMTNCKFQDNEAFVGGGGLLILHTNQNTN